MFQLRRPQVPATVPIVPPSPPSVVSAASKHRITVGEQILFRMRAQPPTSTGTFHFSARILYDDGSTEDWDSQFTNTSTTSVNPWVARDTVLGTNVSGTTISGGPPRRARLNGFVTAISCTQIAGTTFVRGEAYLEALIMLGRDTTQHRDFLGRAYIFGVSSGAGAGARQGTIWLDKDEDLDFRSTFLFQGTVAQDTTVGTHTTTLTITGVAGTEFQLHYGEITVGNTATAQTATADITDGSNRIVRILNPAIASQTVASAQYPIPSNATTTATASTSGTIVTPFTISGVMSLILRVQTTQISVTQTFAVMLRIRGRLPAFTLADDTGTPTLTTNTSTWFT